MKFSSIRKSDWKAITFCVFASITFWFINGMSTSYSVDVVHPMVVHYDEEMYAPLSPLPTEIRFSTTASGWDIFTKTNFVNSSPIEVELDEFKRKTYLTGTRLKSIVAKQMNGIMINEVLDDTIFINVDRFRSKKINLAVSTKKLNFSEGYRLAGSVVIEPSELTISGPSTLLIKIPNTFSIPINEKNIYGTFKEQIPLTPLFDERVKLSNSKALVQFETYKLSRVEVDLTLKKLNFPKKKSISISEEEVTLIYYAKEEDLAALEKLSLKAVVDYDQLQEQSKSIKVTLKSVPDLMKSYQFEPSTIKIRYGE